MASYRNWGTRPAIGRSYFGGWHRRPKRATGGSLISEAPREKQLNTAEESNAGPRISLNLPTFREFPEMPDKFPRRKGAISTRIGNMAANSRESCDISGEFPEIPDEFPEIRVEFGAILKIAPRRTRIAHRTEIAQKKHQKPARRTEKISTARSKEPKKKDKNAIL